MTAIPISSLELENVPDSLEFKRADNISSSDIMDFYHDGDCAPRGRMNRVWYK